MFAHKLMHSSALAHTNTVSPTKKKSPHTLLSCQRQGESSKVWQSVIAGETRTWEVDRWREGDSKKDRQRRRKRKRGSVESVRCRHSPPCSPGNFSVTSCHHLVTRRPCHPVTYPLSNWGCQPVVMRPDSPLTSCFFHTRYREKSRGTGGRAAMSGHAYHLRSQASDINVTGARDLWGGVILWVHYPPVSPVTNTRVGCLVPSHTHKHKYAHTHTHTHT